MNIFIIYVIHIYIYFFFVYLQSIIHAIYRGFMDSLKGAIVLFYMDKKINEKLVKKSPITADLRKRDLVTHSPSKYSSQQRYIYIFLLFYHLYKEQI